MNNLRTFILHSEFNQVTLENDIGLIKLPAPGLKTLKSFIRLPDESRKNDSFEGREVIATGYGKYNPKCK